MTQYNLNNNNTVLKIIAHSKCRKLEEAATTFTLLTVEMIALYVSVEGEVAAHKPVTRTRL